MKIIIKANKIEEIITFLQTVKEWNEKNNEKTNVVLDSKLGHFEHKISK
jgi:hypothetical protein